MEIDSEELQRRICGRSTTPDEERKRCPECESVNISPKTDQNLRNRGKPEDWRCGSCKAHFDEPLEGQP